MKKCDCYRIEPEQHYCVDKYGAPIYENINVPRCWGTKEKDICDCDGDRLKCSFYKNVRVESTDVLENTAETREYLESLPKVYMIARWAGYGVRVFPFAGKYTTDGIPFVWDYDDCNGTCDCYFLRKLTNTTIGWIYAWTTSKSRAEEIAAALNEKVGEDWKNK